jgi:UDP-glucose 4-epimerase
MKALVTGGAGFIGSHIVDKLLSLEWEVIVIDNESAASNEGFYWNEGAHNYKYDICEYEKISPLFEDVDIVFHLAAESRIQPAIENPIQASKTNVVGTCCVLQCARERGVKRVIYSSTSSAYGVVNEPPLQEEMLRDCLNPYSVTKCAGEDLCAMYTKLFGLETVIFRYFNVYGERQPLQGQYAPVVGIFLRQTDDNEPMTIVGDGKQRRDFTHVSDVVESNVLAALSTNTKIVGEIINIGNGKNYSILEVSQLIGDDYIYIPPRLGESRVTLADTRRAQTWLGWKPTTSLDTWIKKQLTKRRKKL